MSTDTEKRLTAQLNKRSAIIDGALDGIVVIDDTGEVRDFNRAAEAMFGYSHDEAIGAQIVDMIIPGIHRDQHLAGFHGYITGDSLNATAATFLRETDAPVVEKPLTRERLLALVSKVGELTPH